MNLGFFDKIWHVSGSLPLPHRLSSEEAFDRLDPLFRKAGTNRQRTGHRLTFTKRDQAAQDRMAVFDAGVLEIRRSSAGSALHYRMSSRIMLFCFLLPLLFLGFAQFTVALGDYEKAAAAAKKEPAEKKKEPVLTQNPIDKFLGSPAPEKPKKDAEKKNKRSPTSAYVFASLFALLYGIGRILEDRMVRSLFRKALSGEEVAAAPIRTMAAAAPSS